MIKKHSLLFRPAEVHSSFNGDVVVVFLLLLWCLLFSNVLINSSNFIILHYTNGDYWFLYNMYQPYQIYA